MEIVFEIHSEIVRWSFTTLTFCIR